MCRKFLPAILSVLALLVSTFGPLVPPAQAGAITGISYPSSGSLTSTYVQPSTNLLIFTPATALSSGDTVTVTFPAGTTLTTANLIKSDFFMEQTAGGSCSTDGGDTQPGSIAVNEVNRTIDFVVPLGALSKSGPPCGEGEMTIKVRSVAGADEIQHPSSPTTTGVLQIDIDNGPDTGSISNVTFIGAPATKLAFTTQPPEFATTSVNFTTQPVVTVQDASGNTVTSATNAVTITAVLATDTNTAAAGALSATTNPLSASSGIAAFAGVQHDTDEDIILKATAAGLTPAYSDVVYVSVPDSIPPDILSEDPVEDATSATINWSTDEDSTAQIEYGLTDTYGNATTETSLLTRGKSHVVVVPSLTACTKYNFRAKSKDKANNKKNGNKKKLVTTGCVGNATVVNDTDATVDPAAGGTVSLLDSGKGVTVVAPTGYTASSANIQAKKLEKTAVIGAISTPSSKGVIGDHIYDLKALTDASTTVSSFSQPLTVTISYDDADLGSIDESTLTIHRHNSSAWSELNNCTVNTAANEVTCTTTAFSVFGLFGTVLASISDTITGSTSAADAPVCTDPSPGAKAPWIYAASPESTTSIQLRFHQGDAPFDNFVLEYGTSPGNYLFSAGSIGGKSTTSYTVSSLAPHTIYYFRIRAGNGCATGPWSNEIFATTKDSIKESIDLPSVEISTQEGDETIPEGEYKVTVKIVNQKNRPVKGVQVVMFSGAKESVTGDDGTVMFEGISPGNHRLIISYGDQQNEHTINLSGDERQVDIVVSINVPTYPIRAIAAISAIAIVVGALAFYLIRKRHSAL